MAFLAAAAPLLGTIGTVASAAGTLYSGIAASSAASYQAKVAENNAQIARQNAIYAKQAGAAKQEQEGLKAAERLGELKAGMAANGVDINSGSAVDAQAGTAAKGVLDQYTVANNADLSAYGYRTQETSFEAQAGLDKATADQAPIGAALGAAGSLFSNSSSISTKWLGVFGDNDGGSPISNKMSASGFSVGGA